MKGLDQFMKQNSPLKRQTAKPELAPVTKKEDKIKFTSLLHRDIFYRWKEQTIKEQQQIPKRRDWQILEEALVSYLNTH